MGTAEGAERVARGVLAMFWSAVAVGAEAAGVGSGIVIATGSEAGGFTFAIASGFAAGLATGVGSGFGAGSGFGLATGLGTAATAALGTVVR